MGDELKPSSSYHPSVRQNECHADRDGECNWVNCPQLKNYQRHCPLDVDTDDE